jgi:type VI secretion system protein ImpL
MKKLQIDLVSILVLALIFAGAILIWGDYAGIKTPETRSLWLSGVALCALVLAVIASFDRLGRWSDAVRVLGKWLHFRKPDMVGTTQASILATKETGKSAPKIFEPLRRELRDELGWRWCYRRTWLLLTGDDAAIVRLMPELAQHGWSVTHDAVLLWSKSGPDGQPDENWLRQLYKLRRRRPVDAVVLTVDGTAELPAQRRATSAYSVNLARITEALHWAAPVYVLDVAQTDEVTNGTTSAIGCEFRRTANASAIETALLAMGHRLADRSVTQLSRNGRDRYAAELSVRMDARSKPLASWIADLSANKRHQSVSGAFFAPYPVMAGRTIDGPTSADLPLWQYLGNVARTEPGRRIGCHPVTVFSTLALSVIGLWSAGMLISGLSNARELHITTQAVQTLATTADSATRLRSLLELQQRIVFYEDRTQHHAPLLSRFGLNHDAEVLAALWTPYAQASRRVLVSPVQQNLEAELVDVGQMQTTQVDDRTNRIALDGHKALKTYLMMADPSRADATFMTPVLMRYWSTNANLQTGEKLDLSERLLGFYAQHLPAHPAWRIQPRPELVNASRQTLLAVIGVKNSEDTIYQSILDTVGNKYPDQTLSSLTAGTDTRGLFHTTVTIPGAFTREAYEGTIAAAIDDAANRSDVSGDWVLANGQNGQQQHQPVQSADALKLALTNRYFADYADHWQGFMNTLQWEPAPTLPASIEQLKLMADARQSPVIALMKSLRYQGSAGAVKESLSDTLVTKAQHVFSGKVEGPEIAKPDPAGPLGVSFGPVLLLVGQGNGNTATGAGLNSDLSLQRFMERVTTLRLKLQQISDSPDADAQARQVAQSLFQGKGSELADTQAYAQLIAASLGAQWAGMGDALFVRPVAQATQSILQPAQASLNDAWRQIIVASWNQSFAGRYPFANTDNDASLPELARFLRPQGGLIAAFLSTQLAGVLELQGDQWVPASTGNATMSIDPTFLNALNTLQRIAGHLLAQGEPQYRFEFEPVPTPGVTDTLLTLDGQKLHYYNQQEAWQALTWPSNNPQNLGTRLQWQTEKAGTNKSFEFSGRWGLVRMLERARVEAIDDATYELTWQGSPDPTTSRFAQAASSASTPAAASGARAVGADRKNNEPNANVQDTESLAGHGPLTPASKDLTFALTYMMRTDVGKGPLELLALRGFVLPTRIFVGKGPSVAPGTKKTAQSDGPPPLPQAMLDAAKHADMPLPGGRAPL